MSIFNTFNSHSHNNNNNNNNASATPESEHVDSNGSTAANDDHEPSSLVMSCVNSPDLKAHMQHICNINWAATSLGPMKLWPAEMSFLIQAIMLDPAPRVLLLGSDVQLLYNPAYGRLIGEAHPGLLGMPATDTWSNHSHILEESRNFINTTSSPYVQRGFPRYFKRDGFLAETILSWTKSKIHGSIPGYYIALADQTELFVGERRRTTLRTLSENCNGAKDLQDFWSVLSQGISDRPFEFPFALLYVSDTDIKTDSRQSEDTSSLHLRASAGDFAPDSPPFDILNLQSSDPHSFEILRRAMESEQPTLADCEQDLFPKAWYHASHSRGHRDPCQRVAIIPVRPTGLQKVCGLLILGLSTRNPYDENYRAWILELSTLLNDKIALVISHQEGVRERQERVQKELAIREKQASLAAGQVQRMLRIMDMAGIGCWECLPSGKLLQANEAWHRQSGHPTELEQIHEFSWLSCVHDDDIDRVLLGWESLRRLEPVSYEMRWKSRDQGLNQDPNSEELWVLAVCVPVTDENGVLTSISGCTTSICAQKRSEKDKNSRIEALERARISEKRFASFAETAPVGIWTADPVTNELTYCNDKCYEYAGETRANDPIDWASLTHEDDVDQVVQARQAVFQNRTQTTFQYRLKRMWINGDGLAAPMWMQATIYPELRSDGSIKQIMGCMIDISHLKLAESAQRLRAEALERARASETQFLRFTEIAPIGIIIVDLPSMQTTFANDKWFELMDMRPTKCTDVDWVRSIYDEDVEHAKRSVASILADCKPRSFQFRTKRMWNAGDGIFRNAWLNDSASVISDDDGNPKALMACLTDISHLKYAESEQRLRVDEALEAKRQQENFIDMTSHEIRNPLSAVVHCADSISESLMEMSSVIKSWDTSVQHSHGQQLKEAIESSVEAVNTITTCSGHQKRIVDDLLTLSKLDSKLLQIHASATQVKTLLRDLERMFEAEAERTGIALVTELDASLKKLQVDWVSIDQGRTNQIAINLATNALKFTKNEDTRKVTIRIGASPNRPLDDELGVSFALAHTVSDGVQETSREDFYLWFTVQDTGRGMSEDEKAKIFNRFTQGSPRTYGEYGGSGLGLFISRELAELQGGEVGVASELGVGSTFGFFIKARSISAPPAPTQNAKLAHLAIRRRPSQAETANVEIHVLVCEDNLVNQRLMQKQLSKHGYKVHVADNGEQALKFLQTTSRWRGQSTGKDTVHVILMDIEMPIMDGLTCTKRIREFERSGVIVSHIPIIAVSANARAEQNDQAVAVGMDDAISKPFRIADLMPKIDRWVDYQSLGMSG